MLKGTQDFQLIMFFEGIRSERQLMETVNVNLAHRWYIGYDLDEPVPDHSSLSKIRTRYGLEVFQLFFEKVVELCVQAGLVWGKELYFDGTKIRANADIDGLVPRWYWKAKQHVQALFQERPRKVAEATDCATTASESAPHRRDWMVKKYDGTRLNENVPANDSGRAPTDRIRNCAGRGSESPSSGRVRFA